MPEIIGYHHVSITVRDIEASTAWYTDVLGFAKAKDVAGDGFRKVILVHPASGTAFGLTDHGARASGDVFDEFRTGMDHLAFAVADRVELDAWKTHFEELGVVHSEISPAALGHVIVVRDPDKIQLQVYAPSVAS